MRKIWNNEKIYDMKFVLDEKCRNAFNITKEYFKTNKKKPVIFTGTGILLLILILGISFSYANLTPVSSVEIFSENANFENKDMGSWKVTKSAEWIEEDVANINVKIESNLGIGNFKAPSDYIFVFEDSAKMGAVGQEKINILYQFCLSLFSEVLSANEENKVAVITFNSNYNIVSDFSRDLDPGQLNFNVSGNTNYYQALNGVNELLSNYTKEEGKNCKVVFITAGSPNEETPNEVEYSKMLRNKYPYLKINSIASFYGDNENKTSLYNISDSVSMLSAGLSEFEQLHVAIESLNVNNYLGFKIEDTINSEYFEVIEATSNIGEVTVDKSLENDRVIWDLKDKYYSNTIEEMDIKIKLKDEYKSADDLLMFQTNIQAKITSLIYNLDGNEAVEEVVSSLTPVLSTNYAVIYDNNEPDTCTVSGTPETKRYTPFTTVEISEDIPTCNGYKFKGWKLVEDNVEKIGKDYFIMPSHDVTLKAEWSKVSIKKSMNSRVVEEGTLYAMMAANSVPDNVSSDFVTNTTGINFTQISSDTNGKGIYQMASTAQDDRPIYYYRGAVDNNNVKFANFCWKIVRTTGTGGVKLIYNGPPDGEGGCTNTTGEITTIGQSYFFDINSESGLYYAAIGYMYGTKYPNKLSLNTIKWYDFLDVDEPSSGSGVNGYDLAKYYVSDDVSYDSQTDQYSLINPITASSLSSSDMIGKYFCEKGSTSCYSVNVITDYFGHYTTRYSYFIKMSNGNKLPVPYKDLNTQMVKFGKSAQYNNGMYILNDIYEIGIFDAVENFNSIVDYPYSCYSINDRCSDVNYKLNTVWFLLSNGETHIDLIEYITSGSPNEIDSGIKKVIDNWYSSNLADYTTYLEDTIWCNDREFYGNISLPELTGSDEKFFAHKNTVRLFQGKPSLECLLGDSFSVEVLYKDNEQIGNGKLIYPTATLTADEVVLAGLGLAENSDVYLYNGVKWNTLTPFSHAIVPVHYIVGESGTMTIFLDFNNVPYVRPSVSLKAGTKAVSGDGTPTNPFVIE